RGRARAPSGAAGGGISAAPPAASATPAVAMDAARSPRRRCIPVELIDSPEDVAGLVVASVRHSYRTRAPVSWRLGAQRDRWSGRVAPLVVALVVASRRLAQPVSTNAGARQPGCLPARPGR